MNAQDSTPTKYYGWIWLAVIPVMWGMVQSSIDLYFFWYWTRYCRTWNPQETVWELLSIRCVIGFLTNDDPRKVTIYLLLMFSGSFIVKSLTYYLLHQFNL